MPCYNDRSTGYCAYRGPGQCLIPIIDPQDTCQGYRQSLNLAIDPQYSTKYRQCPIPTIDQLKNGLDKA